MLAVSILTQSPYNTSGIIPWPPWMGGREAVSLRSPEHTAKPYKASPCHLQPHSCQALPCPQSSGEGPI
jgi:hypothetical protein